MASSAPSTTSLQASLANSVAGSSSSSQTNGTSERRAQAGPLPIKIPRLVGEIGYTDNHAQEQEADLADGAQQDSSIAGLNAAEADAALNGRHPADRSHVDLSQTTSVAADNASSQVLSPVSTTADSTTQLNPITTAASKPPSKSSTFWKSRYLGVKTKTWLYFEFLVLAFIGTAIGWVLGTKKLNQSTNAISPIFIHLCFAIVILVLIILIERCIFQMRAERYAHLHPGEILPSHHNRRNGETMSGPNGIALAPWNRPPLPTYAAALGFRGTGDVEDSEIAPPPPPAYGNVRDSVLLLAGAATNRIRQSFRRSTQRQSNRLSTIQERRISGISTRSNNGPISYEASQYVSDAERARALEETLARLEGNNGRRTSNPPV